MLCRSACEEHAQQFPGLSFSFSLSSPQAVTLEKFREEETLSHASSEAAHLLHALPRNSLLAK